MVPIIDLLNGVRSQELDRSFLEQTQLDVSCRDRTNALPWRGQFTPGLPAALLTSLAPSGTVLDPFVGSGTTLAECVALGIPSVGAEINPAAISLALVYSVASLEAGDRKGLLKDAEGLLNDSIFQAPDGLLRGVAVHEHLAARLEGLQSDPIGDLAVAALMLSMGNASTTTTDKLAKAWKVVKNLVVSLPPDPLETRVLGADARDLPLEDDTAGMVLTSPPYINVFNYHQNYRPAMELLGWDILPAARSEIGSNRKHRANRFLTVVQYCIDMAMTLDEMARVTREGSPVVIVVGRESRVRGVAFPNGDILAALGELSPHLTWERWQERSFVSRFGETIFEEVLTFRTHKSPVQTGPICIDEHSARSLGVALLEEAAAHTEASSVADDLASAIAGSDAVMASVPLKLERACLVG